MESSSKPKPAAKTITNSEDNLERSIRRTKSAIKDYVHCNSFDLFVTFTFESERNDPDNSKQKLNNWIKNQRKRTGSFQYLVVPEFHKDAESLHFHALFQGFNGKVSRALNPHTQQPLTKRGGAVYDLPSYRSGFSDAYMLTNDSHGQVQIAYYLQKYITKDMPLFKGRNRYWASKGLKKPIEEDNPDDWYLERLPDRTYSNDWGVILEYDKKDDGE